MNGDVREVRGETLRVGFSCKVHCAAGDQTADSRRARVTARNGTSLESGGGDGGAGWWWGGCVRGAACEAAREGPTAGDCKCPIDAGLQFRSMELFCRLEGHSFPLVSSFCFVPPPPTPPFFFLSAQRNLYPQF